MKISTVVTAPFVGADGPFDAFDGTAGPLLGAAFVIGVLPVGVLVAGPLLAVPGTAGAPPFAAAKAAIFSFILGSWSDDFADYKSK